MTTLRLCILAAILTYFTVSFFYNRPFFQIFIKSLRISRHIYYSVITLGGMLLAAKNYAVAPGIFSVPVFIYGLVLINLMFSASVILNNFYDISIDNFNKKFNPLVLSKFDRRRYIAEFWVQLMFSLVLASLLSPAVIACALLIHLVSWIYSAPPLRLKSVFPANALLISLASILALFFGYTAVAGAKAAASFPWRGAFALFTVLTGAFTVKDINDYTGDKKGGIATLPTIFGFENGKKTIAMLVILTYTSFPAMLGSFLLIPASFIAGLLTSVLILKTRRNINEPAVFSIMFLFIAVCVIICYFRGIGCIPGIY